MNSSISESNPLNRFDPSASTCDIDSLYSDFFDGFFGKFQDSFFYTFVIQFIIVTLMHMNVGKGKYWQVLFYAAAAGLLGSILENGTVATLCLKSNEKENYSFVPTFLICELFWIPSEYAIPYLNLIKMEAFSKGKMAKSIKYVIIGLTFPFIFFRFLIGYERMNIGFLQSPLIHTYHGYAFFIMAIADILCTLCILYFVRKNKDQTIVKASNINNYVKHSSYTILITVDIVSSFLSILNILTNIGPLADKISDNIVKPLHCLKCSFILILAADALIFKYGANVSSIHESSGNNSKTYGNGGADSSNNHNFTYSGNYKSRANFSNDVMGSSSISKNRSNPNFNINVSPYNYPSIDNDVCNYKSPESISFSPQTKKSIIKNYTNIKTSPSMYERPSPSADSDKTFEVKVYPTQTFGFLNQ